MKFIRTYLKRISLSIIAIWTIWLALALWTPIHTGTFYGSVNGHSKFSDQFAYDQILDYEILPSITGIDSYTKQRVEEELISKSASKSSVSSAIYSYSHHIMVIREALYIALIFTLLGYFVYTKGYKKWAAILWILTPLSHALPIMLGHSTVNDDALGVMLVALPVTLGGLGLLVYLIKGQKPLPEDEKAPAS